MSTLWTPGGERPVRRPGAEQPPAEPAGAASGPTPSGNADEAAPSDAELEAKMAELRKQLGDAPADVVIANHCFGLFELAALHLSLEPPKLPQAQLAIDAMGAVVEGLVGRLGAAEQQLRDGLAQLRLAYVQIKSAQASQS